MAFYFPVAGKPVNAVALPLIDKAGIVSARLAIMPTANATSDAIEEFEEMVRTYHAEFGDGAAERTLALIDAAGLVPPA